MTHKSKKKIMIVAGARPNFMKIAPLMMAFDCFKKDLEIILVHTGQHYDFQMSQVFFQDLGIPEPDIFLEVGSASHAEQTAKIMTAFEPVMVKHKPDVVVVVGDVNSTVGCALVASKLNCRVVHVEAGLRSFDRTMPEEINRMVTDCLADFLYVSEESGLQNLKKEGIPPSKIVFCGNVMIDTLIANRHVIARSAILQKLNLEPQSYAVVTLHRPSNVDSPEAMDEIYTILKSLNTKITLVYPVHPRTKVMMGNHGLLKKFEDLPKLLMVEPMGYCNFICLVKNSRFVLTDSGGIQEETTFLRIPCLTMRDNTERPSTIRIGTNQLVGRDQKSILKAVEQILKGKIKRGRIPPLWDGRAAQRIARHLTHVT